MRRIIMMTYLLTILITPAYATGGHHHHHGPISPPTQVSNDDDRSPGQVVFGIAIITLIGCGIYAVTTDKMCFTGDPLTKPRGDDGTVMTPKVPVNEFTIERR